MDRQSLNQYGFRISKIRMRNVVSLISINPHSSKQFRSIYATKTAPNRVHIQTLYGRFIKDGNLLGGRKKNKRVDTYFKTSRKCTMWPIHKRAKLQHVTTSAVLIGHGQ